ncbi:MAG: AAA family ATPase [Bacteroides sp.]|nr:AAA family ATPase [Bacteroides sp.]
MLEDPNFNIKIDNVELINYKRFINSKISFDRHLTVLCGKNGSGKSTVLSSVTLILSWIIARLRNENGVGLYISPISVNNQANNGCVIGEIFNGNVTIPNKAKAGISKDYTFNIAPIKEYVQIKRSRYTNKEEVRLPVFAYYGVKRAVLDMPIRTRRKEYSTFDTYEKCLEGAANFRSFFTWFRACEDWENEQTVREGRQINHSGLNAFRRALERFMPDYNNIRIERHPLSMKLEKKGQTINAEQLSDGEKIYLALIGDLCHRLSLANPNGDPLQGDGIVLIDEIDLHLHPQWQSEIVNTLTKTFPNIQFIITTHSPHVINSVPTTSLRIISDEGEITTSPYGYGMPSEIVLGDIMDLSNDVPKEVLLIIDTFNTAISEKNPDEAKKQLSELQKLVPLHPELPRMRKRVERISQ